MTSALRRVGGLAQKQTRLLISCVSVTVTRGKGCCGRHMWMAPESGPGREGAREEAAKGNNAAGGAAVVVVVVVGGREGGLLYLDIDRGMEEDGVTEYEQRRRPCRAKNHETYKPLN